MHNLFSACARALSSFGDMMAFAAPAKKYPTVSAEEINAAAWGATGHAMRQAMRTVDEQLTSEQRQRLI